MGLEINWAFALAFIIGLALLYISGSLIIRHPKNILGYVLNSVLGIIMLIILKEILIYCGFILPINALTIILSGLLGVPEVILSIIKTLLF